MPRKNAQSLAVSILACSLSLLAGLSIPAQAETGLYIRGGLGIDWSEDARFRDENCAQTQPPALFGCGLGQDGRPLAARGDFGTSLAAEAGIGYRFLPALRGEALISYRPEFEFSGNANFLRTPGPQPVSADIESLSAMLVGFVDLVGPGMPSLGPVEPFLGAGLGISRHHVGNVNYAFPGLGANASTVTSGGTDTSVSFMLVAGAALRLSERLTLDIAYRHLDLGEVRTEAGPAVITRPRFTRVLEIAGTEADLATHGISVSLRFQF